MNERVKDSVSVSLELSLVTMLVNLLSCLLLLLSSSRSLSLVKSLLLLRVLPVVVLPARLKPAPCHAHTVETFMVVIMISFSADTPTFSVTLGNFWKNGIEIPFFSSE